MGLRTKQTGVGAVLIVLILATAFFVGVVSAEPQTQTWTLDTDVKPRPAGEPYPDLLADPEALQQFVDDYVGGQLDSAHIAGAVFLAIKDGKVIMQKGYGVKDIETQEPIDPVTSMFFVASISKTFLATAAMRFIEQYGVSLDSSIAELAPSLNIESHLMGDEPVTLRHALTHSTGFPDMMLNSTAPNEEKFERFRPLIRQYLGDQAARPGQYYYYCNVCITMVAAVIEEVSGKNYEDFLQEEVFDPLDMKYATMAIPVNPRVKNFKDNFVKTYIYDKKTNEFDVQPHFIRNLYPPSLIALSAQSITNYMMMHMNGGRFNGKAFLSPASHAEMHRHQGSNHPNIPGYKLPFKEGKRNGVEYYGHSGDYRGNDSTMMFLKGYDFGFFLSYTGDNNTFYRHFINDFIDKAFPRQRETVTANLMSDKEGATYEGEYTGFRYNEITPMQLVWPLFGQFRVTAKDGLLHIDYPGFYFKGGSATYAKVDDELFRKVDSGEPNRIGGLLVDYAVFKKDANGKPSAYLSSLQNHSFVLVDIPWYMYMSHFKPLLAFAGGGMGLFSLIGAVVWVLRKAGKLAPVDEPLQARLLKRFTWLASVCGIVFLVAFFYILMNTRPINLTYGFDDIGLMPYFVLPLITAGLFLPVIALTVLSWVRGLLPMFSRVVISVTVLALTVWVFLSVNTNLLTFYLT
jgi:CubicO group peptidase (beta-lactamase class C family)